MNIDFTQIAKDIEEGGKSIKQSIDHYKREIVAAGLPEAESEKLLTMARGIETSIAKGDMKHLLNTLKNFNDPRTK